ncbi:GntR family transcriptional regulator [Rhizobiaceae bacterium BDR2-2]|uniref:GntR family transcriptional regulator n=1 Tax=Ectorhizobium quercum TaxID=2965071 RepID=A0AAE3MZ82_9HYPH|nr:GntR family transcriptional regulator [Ectorhizobium quercum]MCX8995942.1 GntR family transcriptional regulator [Ectorhizobium quercum]
MAKRVRDGSKVFSSIRDSILRLELRPGAVIDEAELATRLDVSRTPVREAIIQLISDGLVIRDGRTARIAPLDFDEVPKLYDALLVSSRMVHRLAAQNRTEKDLRKIKATMIAFEEGIKTGDGLSRSELNVDFHLAISAAAHNSYFEDFYEGVLFATIRLARACFSGDEPSEFAPAYPDEDIAAHLAETARHHRLMYETILKHDVEGSDRMAVLHENLSKARLQRKLFSTSEALTPEVSLAPA